ncbi:putative vinorine synthase [Helianthus anomalus]
MRRFLISTLSSSASRRGSAYHHLNDGYAFSGSRTMVSDRAAPQQDTGHKLAWQVNMRKNWRYMSNLTNPPDTIISYNESNLKGEEKDAVRIKVITREHIKPSSPTPQSHRYYKFSMFDQVQVPIYHPLMVFYTNNDSKNIEEVISDRSNHLKQSLSETLTRMYPFAGKLASELHIDCNDDGVYYVETRVNDRLNNVLQKPDHKFLQRLIPVVDSIPNQPFLCSYVSMIQVNFFECGGVSIIFQNNHKLADGNSTMTFMRTWAAIARRDPNQIYPNFVPSQMFPQNPQLPYLPYIPLWYLAVSPVCIKHGKCETKRLCFDALALQKLKAKASKHQPVSRVAAVLALLWKCVTTATYSKPSFLHMPVNIRQRFSPALNEYSIGNVLSGASVRFDPGASNLELASMASNLKNAVADSKGGSVDELKGENAHVRFVDSLRKSMEMVTDFKTEYYLAASMCNSKSKEIDFGWGKPVWVCSGNQLNDDVPLFTNRMMLMDSCSSDGIEAWVTLEKEVMDVVKCNAELLSFASVDPSPL